MTIAHNVVADARKRARLVYAVAEEATTVADPSTPETERHRGELRQALAHAASQLLDDQREVFVLAELHGLPMAEIAQVVGAPENTVKTRLFRARDRLRSLLAGVLEG